MMSSAPSLTTNLPTKQHGFFLMVLIILIVGVGIFAAVVTYMSVVQSQATANRLFSTQSFQLAQAGLEGGTFLLTSPETTSVDPIERRYACSDISFTNIALGEGRFAVTSTGTTPFDAETDLSSAINNSTSIIPVDSLAGFATKGRVRINKEAIDYYGTSSAAGPCGGSAPCLIHAKRGQDGSTAVAHANNSPVAQYQCDIEATGFVPDATNPKGKRTLRQSVQLQKAWAVGDDGAGEHIGFWDGETWVRAGPFAGIPNGIDLNAVYALSYADVWAVGDSGLIAHFDGSTWTQFSIVGPASGTRLNDVFCIDTDDCWAVGDSERFFRWNGTSWSLFQDTGSNRINGVFCNSSSDCWAVATSEEIFRFNGVNWFEFQDAGSTNLNSVFCNSASDCWAVGSSERTFRFTGGGAWNQFSDTGNRQLRSVFCVAADDCWTVGNNRRFLRFNGIGWSVVNTAAIPNTTYLGVACYNTQDCWAVGLRGGGLPRIVHWNGSAWSQFTIAGFPNRHLRGISVVGPKTNPTSAWSEVTD